MYPKIKPESEKKGTVLIIEDEKYFRSFLENIIKDKFNYFSAGSWSEAKSLLYENSIDIVIADLRLPGLSGKQIIETIHREFKNSIITIVITGYEQDWEQTSALNSGVYSYFKKGNFSPPDLIQVLNRCISKREETFPCESSSKEFREQLSRGISTLESPSSDTLIELYDFTNRLIALDSLDSVLDAVIKMIKKITGCNRISVMLLSDNSQYLYIKKAIGLNDDIINSTRIHIGSNRKGKNIAGKVFQDKKIISSRDLELENTFFHYLEDGPFMSIPLSEVPYKEGKKPIGVINLTNKEGGRFFSEAEKGLLLYLANSASIAIKNELRKEALEKSSVDTLILLANVLEARDRYTQGHSMRVGEYAYATAKLMGFYEDRLKEIRYAGQLHDIGKIEIPDSILLKKAKLTPREYQVMKRHPITSKRIVDHLSIFHHIKGLFLHHHEHYDGNGYPDGIGGEEIELGARIISVADAYDAMTSKRPYRNAMPQQTALSILLEQKGRQFDPRCVEAFTEYITHQQHHSN